MVKLWYEVFAHNTLDITAQDPILPALPPSQPPCQTRRGRGSYVTITHGALNLTPQDPLPPPHPTPTWELTAQGLPGSSPGLALSRHGTSLYMDPLLVTSGGHHWRPVQTYTFRGC